MRPDVSPQVGGQSIPTKNDRDRDKDDDDETNSNNWQTLALNAPGPRLVPIRFGPSPLGAGQGSAAFVFRGPDSQHFRIGKDLSQLLTSAFKAQKQPYTTHSPKM